MTISEQAVAAAANSLRATLRIKWDENLEVGRISEENIETAARAALEAALPLVGVQRHEDVARRWQKIESRNTPFEAEYERRDLMARLREEPDVAVAILLSYATVAPKQGSYAGSLWALAEYVKTLLAAPPLRAREEIARLVCNSHCWAFTQANRGFCTDCQTSADLILSRTAGQEWRDINLAREAFQRIIDFPYVGVEASHAIISIARGGLTSLSAPPVAEPIVAEKSQVK